MNSYIWNFESVWKGDPIFSTWKSHTIFSTSFFWFWNVPILGGDFGILKKYLKVEKLVISNNFVPKYRFLHLQIETLGLSSDEDSSFQYFSCKIFAEWKVWISNMNLNFLKSKSVSTIFRIFLTLFQIKLSVYIEDMVRDWLTA